ncbi:MAG: LytTR family transcriptional regulator DNA-binding domain-containing protein [Lachnospiraceae bacterium]|nr:LytTR family transcriptional regulator DNA-binding domain-containing protein [Lachnospiraceae bacterium]
MDNRIDIKVEIDQTCASPQVIIKADQHSGLIEKIIYAVERCVSDEYPNITAYNGNEVILLNQWDIIRIYTENRKLTICTKEKTYGSRMSLKELEEILDDEIFVRISRFELINLKKVSSFDLSISGTIKVIFENGTETWVARRCVRSIQEKLKKRASGGDRHE